MDLNERYCDHCGAAYIQSAAACTACGKSLKVTRELRQEAAVSVTPALRLTEHLQTLQLFNERYRIMSQVGVGGFGAVYEAFDTWEPRRVAIKEIGLSGLSAQQIIEATGSFNREVQMLSSLSHPGIPRIYEHTTDTEHWYLVMEFIPGKTLENIQEQAQRGCLPLEWILQIGVQISEILNYLHSRQPAVIFRDIKPANIMVTPERNLYLIDFGVARRYQRERTRDTIAFGSPGYAPPEQYGRAQTTPLSDIYSLGALLYCLLTGDDPSTHPFKFSPLHLSGRAGGREMDAILLDRLIQQMVASDPVQRPQQVSAELRRIQQVHYQISHQSRQLAPIWFPPQGQTPPGLAPSSGKRQSSPSAPTLSQPSVQPASSSMITLGGGQQQQQMILTPSTLAPQSQPTTTTIVASSGGQQQQQMILTPSTLAPQSQPTPTTIVASSSGQQQQLTLTSSALALQSQPTTTTIGASSSGQQQQMIFAPGQQQATAATIPSSQQSPAVQAPAQKLPARKTSRRRVLISSLIAGGSLLTLSLAAVVWGSSQNGTATTPDLTNIPATAAAQNSPATPTSVSQQAVVPANGDTNWSADLRYAVVDNSSKNQLEVYAVSPQKLLCTIPYNSIPYSYHYSFNAVSWSTDNSKFLMYPYVLETKTGRKLYTLVSPSSQEPSYTPFARWSPDGRSIVWNTSSYNQDYNTVTLTNATNGKTLIQKTFPGTNIASCIAWSPDSRSIAFPNTDSSTWTVGQPWSVGIVDIATFKQVGTLSDTLPASPFLNASSFASASGIAWSPEGTRIAVTINDHAWIFTVEKTTTNFFVLAPTSFSVPLYAVPVWSPDSSFVAFYSDTSLSVYNTWSNTSQTLINESQPSNVMALAWSDNSQSITSADDKNRIFTWTIQ